MYEKYKINMKVFAILGLTILITMNSIHLNDSIKADSIKPITKPVLDEDFFRNELQESVLEFAKDAGVHPDSVYMPFKKKN